MSTGGGGLREGANKNPYYIMSKSVPAILRLNQKEKVSTAIKKITFFAASLKALYNIHIVLMLF